MPQKTYPIIQDDPWLKPYQEDIDERYMFFSKKRKEIEKEEAVGDYEEVVKEFAIVS